MTDQNFFASHLDVTFAIGECWLTITPEHFGVNRHPGEWGFIFCRFPFKSGLYAGRAEGDIDAADFGCLRRYLMKVLKGEADSVSIGTEQGTFLLEGQWNAQKQVVIFKATIPASWKPGDWEDYYEGCEFRNWMRCSIELEFWMKPEALEEPLGALDAIWDRIRVMRQPLFPESDYDEFAS